MAISIISPENSFVRFDEATTSPLCIWGDVNYCLPVYEAEDIYFQFIIQGTELEIDSLCTQSNSSVTVSLFNECGGDTEYITFSERPQRVRLATTQVLYNWSHGFVGFPFNIPVGGCFVLQVQIDATPYGYPEEVATFCSNCFERIGNNCYTSVIEYGNDEDGFDFKYCAGGAVDGGGTDETTCDPTIITFASVATLAIPYIASMVAKYGVFPTVQVWIYDGTGQLLNMGITAAFDTYPPTMINLDFGGPASGIVVIR